MAITKYTTMTFSDVYPEVNQVLDDYQNCGIPTTISSKSMQTLYYLVLARFSNSPLANNDINQFKLKFFSIVFQYGPTWEKRLEIQKSVRELSNEDLLNGATNIYNTALNPGSEPNTHTKDELDYINQQNVNKYKRSKIDAYAVQWGMLKVDVTENILNEFKKLFKLVVADEMPILYSDEDCEEGE